MAAVLLCASGLAAAVPEAAAAPAPTVAAAPERCLSGVRRVQVTCLPAATRRLCVVQYAWIPFPVPCLKSGGSAR
ncbi:hypothetical protein [Amycolatopsis kentuckyensis]|uniref:hypothetical protein n=1 Tax=Amycolatopsis kentuckyensis TaxID=218823 RepID=UPI00142DA7B0|nr:hypothetical protein [Amycolatopsis kentuckyensis]